MLIIVIIVVVAVMVIDVISVGESHKAEQLKKLGIPEESWNKTYLYGEDFAKMLGRDLNIPKLIPKEVESE